MGYIGRWMGGRCSQLGHQLSFGSQIECVADGADAVADDADAVSQVPILADRGGSVVLRSHLHEGGG